MDDDARWRAVETRDAGASGSFVFAVRTTGVYCVPSCGARRPRRANVQFFADGAAARAAGFRPCKRCSPGDATRSDRRTDLVTSVCRRIDEAIVAGQPPPGLRALAALADLSPFHLQRVFRTSTGLSPHAYAAAVRASRVRRALGEESTVTRALHSAGYGSSARFYADAGDVLGMAPRRHRTGAGERIGFATARCSLGIVLVAATARGLCAIHLGDDATSVERELRERFPGADVRASAPAFRRDVDRVVAFVDGERTDLGLPLDIRGTAFQQRVWRAIAAIPRGATASYTELADRLQPPSGARAVARACAANPLAVLVPCHRVVRTDGGLAGYRWGASRKAALLSRERGEKARSRR